jgi:hypothetical protein
VPLLIGLLAVVYRGAWPRRIALVVGPLTLIAATYTILWFSVARTNAQDDLLITAWFEIAFAHLLQGLAYPVVALARLIVGSGDVSPGPVIGLVIAVAAPVWIWAWRQSRAMGLAATYGAAWYVLSLLPSAVLLGPDYVLGSPRLMLVASIGGSLFWGVIMALAAHKSGRQEWKWGWRLAQAVLVIFPLIVSLSFLQQRRIDFIHLGDYTWRLLDLFGTT